MQRATIPIMALYRQKPTLFNNLSLPVGMIKSDLINRLLLELGELEAVYTNPEVMEDAIGFWSNTRVAIWEKIYKIMTYEYNPIWNVDGETWHDGTSESHGTQTGTSERDYTRSRTEAGNSTSERDYNRSRTDNNNYSETVSEDNDTTNFISADNSAGWSNDTKQEYDGERSTSGSNAETENITDNDDISESRNTTESITDGEEGHTSGRDDRTGAESWHEKRQGNIGTTMTQTLLEAEAKLWSNYDIYAYIIEDFKQEFCIMIW